jgi:hypothetical protein
VAEAGEIKLLRESFNPLAMAQAQLPHGAADIPPPGDEVQLNPEQLVPLQRQDVASERGAIHHLSSASALIVNGPLRLSFARIENWVVRRPVGAMT